MFFEWIESISLNILAALLMSSAVLLWPKLRQRKIQRLFSRKNKRLYDIVCTTIEYQKTPFHVARPVTAYGELLALAELYSTFNNLGGVEKFVDVVRMSTKESYSNDRLSNNIISVGGSTYNRITKIFNDHCHKNWKIIAHDSHDGIVDGDYFYENIGNGNIYKAEKDNRTDRISLDFGLVTKFQNPFNPNSSIIIIDGLHTYGLIGAAKALSPNYLKKHSNQFNSFKDEYFQVLVESKVVDLDVYVSSIQYFKI